MSTTIVENNLFHKLAAMIGSVAGLDFFRPTDVTQLIYYYGPKIDMSCVMITPEWTNTP